MFLGIDYGKRRIGLAIGAVLPRGFGVLKVNNSSDEVLEAVSRICQENEVTDVVIGIPLRSQGEEGTIAGEIREFGSKVGKATNLPVHYEPEQFTSVEAERVLKSERGQIKDKSKIDETAAVLLLEQFINQRSRD